MSEPTRGETLERMLHASADNFWGKYEAGMRYAASLVRTASDELDAATPPAEGLPTDGLATLISTILRKYGGTMKGRGDHDIFDALVRYRAALAPEQPE